MRKLTAILSAAAIVTIGAVAGAQTGASASPTAPLPSLSLTTTMISFTPVTVASGPLKPGDGYVLAGRIMLHGKAEGLATAACTWTVVKGPHLRVCTIDYAMNNGLIATTGFINSPAPGAPVTLVVEGGTGAFKDVRGYGKLQPTPTGSGVTLFLTK